MPSAVIVESSTSADTTALNSFFALAPAPVKLNEVPLPAATLTEAAMVVTIKLVPETASMSTKPSAWRSPRMTPAVTPVLTSLRAMATAAPPLIEKLPPLAETPIDAEMLSASTTVVLLAEIVTSSAVTPSESAVSLSRMTASTKPETVLLAEATSTDTPAVTPLPEAATETLAAIPTTSIEPELVAVRERSPPAVSLLSSISAEVPVVTVFSAMESTTSRVTAAPEPVDAAMLAEAATTLASIVALLSAEITALPVVVTDDPLIAPASIEFPIVLNARAPVPCPPSVKPPPTDTDTEAATAVTSIAAVELASALKFAPETVESSTTARVVLAISLTATDAVTLTPTVGLLPDETVALIVAETISAVIVDSSLAVSDTVPGTTKLAPSSTTASTVLAVRLTATEASTETLTDVPLDEFDTDTPAMTDTASISALEVAESVAPPDDEVTSTPEIAARVMLEASGSPTTISSGSSGPGLSVSSSPRMIVSDPRPILFTATAAPREPLIDEPLEAFETLSFAATATALIVASLRREPFSAVIITGPPRLITGDTPSGSATSAMASLSISLIAIAPVAVALTASLFEDELTVSEAPNANASIVAELSALIVSPPSAVTPDDRSCAAVRMAMSFSVIERPSPTPTLDPSPPTLIEAEAEPAVAVIVLVSVALSDTSPVAVTVLEVITASVAPAMKLPDPDPAPAIALAPPEPPFASDPANPKVKASISMLDDASTSTSAAETVLSSMAARVNDVMSLTAAAAPTDTALEALLSEPPVVTARAAEPASALMTESLLACTETLPVVVIVLGSMMASMVASMSLPDPEPAPPKVSSPPVETAADPASVRASIVCAPVASRLRLPAFTVELLTFALTTVSTALIAMAAPIAISVPLSPEPPPVLIPKAAPPASALRLVSSRALSETSPAVTAPPLRISARVVFVTVLPVPLPAPENMVLFPLPLWPPLELLLLSLPVLMTPATLIATESMSPCVFASTVTSSTALIVLPPNATACTSFSTSATVMAPPIAVVPPIPTPPATEVTLVESMARSSTSCAALAPVFTELMEAPVPRVACVVPSLTSTVTDRPMPVLSASIVPAAPIASNRCSS